MSLQVAVLMEVSDANGESSYVRVYRSETVLPARISEGDDGGAMALAAVALDRLVDDVRGIAQEQLGQMTRLVEAASE